MHIDTIKKLEWSFLYSVVERKGFGTKVEEMDEGLLILSVHIVLDNG